MRPATRHLLVLLCALLLAGLAPTARAHPLGNFTVNHYSRLELAGDGVRVYYVLDMAEIPTFQEQARIDRNGDGVLSAEELAAYADARAEELRANLYLAFDGVPAPLRLLDRALSFPPGVADLPTLRLEAVYFAALPAGAAGPVALVFRDENAPHRVGWREVVARPGTPDTVILASTVPADDLSDALRNYPEDLLNSPLHVREASVTFVPGAAAAAGPPSLASAAVTRARDAYAELVRAEELTPAVVVFSLVTALVLGALHALSPGHGKTMVAAYLVGSRGTAWHAVVLGATVTLTHTAGVYALGLVTLTLQEYIVPERLYPYLQLVSGLLVVAIGLALLRVRCRDLVARWRGAPLAGHHHDHAHSHSHHHGHHSHAHHHAEHAWSPRGTPAMAAAPASSVPVVVPPAATEAHRHGAAGPTAGRVGWRGLLLLGISGGLLPCPSALVVLLSAIALQRLGFGLLLIVAFSLGLASVLVGIGLLLVYARRAVAPLPRGALARAGPWVPVLSALVVLAVGLVLSWQALGALYPLVGARM